MSELNEARARPIVPTHIATAEVQTLHALLRIEEATLRTEEVLNSILEGMRFAAKQLTKNEPEADTPAPKGKRK